MIAIIGMLGAISITTVRASIQSAKETQTRTTIAKIDNVLTACYEKYQYRRVGLSNINGGNRWVQLSSDAQYRRLIIIRDLLRCDFPCTPAELYMGLVNYTYPPFIPTSETTPLQAALRSIIASDSLNSSLSGDPIIANAELLYLVVMNGDPEARSLFAEREVNDVDKNGLNEFIDGWGNPICWFRWAPGLDSSDRQPLISDVESQLNNFGSLDAKDKDPFDPSCVGDGWFLVPYIYSAGPDGEYGLTMPNATNIKYMDNPFLSVADEGTIPPVQVGSPLAGTRTYKDNIDNHTLVR